MRIFHFLFFPFFSATVNRHISYSIVVSTMEFPKLPVLLVLLFPSLVAVAACPACTPVASYKSLRFSITHESSCNGGPFHDLMRTPTPSTCSSGGSIGSSGSSRHTTQQSSRDDINSCKYAAFLNVRGGASSSPSSSPNIDITSWKSVLSFSQGLFTDYVQPLLADPEGKIFQPARAFLEQQAANAQERRQSDQEHPDVSSAASEILLQPTRILRLTVASLLLAQVFETTGLLEDKSLPAAWRKHAQPFLQDMTSNLQRWWKKYPSWWKAARSQGGLLSASTWSHPALLSSSWKTHVSPKYQMAVGLGIGMVFSPAMWSIAAGLLETGIVAYLLAEVLHPLQYHWQNDWLGGGGGVWQKKVAEWDFDICTTVCEFLEKWRQTVRDAVQHPQAVWSAVLVQTRVHDSDSDDTGGLFPAHMRRGVLVGAVVGDLIETNINKRNANNVSNEVFDDA
jgi:hypothetical protein